ncbi:MAG: sugar phosphate isomerase/epimerase [Bacteroidia bacterium]
MKYNRRKFVQVAGAVAAGTLVLPQWACKSGGSQTAVTEGTEAAMGGTLKEFGLQLYTLRDDLPADPKGILKQVASFGYKQLEGYEGPQGLFWNMPHMEFKAYLDELGMTMISSHCNFRENFETKAAQAAEIGMKYLLAPWVGPQKTLDDFKKIADTFNECGEICRQNGIRFGYHNHGYSFQELEGQFPQDYMMENTDPATVDFEMDIYWVVTGGADPIAYLEKYPNRFRLCHVKDRTKGAPEGEADASCDLGTGSIDYAKILKVAAENGMEYYIVEQEKYENSTPLKSAEVDAQYLKNLVFA